MGIYLPIRIYLLTSILVEDFIDINYRNRLAATLAILSTDSEELQLQFLEHLSVQNDSIVINKEAAELMLPSEKERYSFFLNSSLVRVNNKTSGKTEMIVLYEYLSRGTAKLNKFIYLHNYINNVHFLFFILLFGLINFDDFKTAQHITRLGYGLTEVLESEDLIHNRNVGERLKRKLYSMMVVLPVDVSQFDPIYTVAVN